MPSHRGGRAQETLGCQVAVQDPLDLDFQIAQGSTGVATEVFAPSLAQALINAGSIIDISISDQTLALQNEQLLTREVLAASLEQETLATASLGAIDSHLQEMQVLNVIPDQLSDYFDSSTLLQYEMLNALSPLTNIRDLLQQIVFSNSELNITMSAIKNDVHIMQSDLAAVKREVELIKTSVTTIETSVTTIEASTTAIETSATAIEGSIAAVAGDTTAILGIVGDIALDTTDISVASDAIVVSTASSAAQAIAFEAQWALFYSAAIGTGIVLPGSGINVELVSCKQGAVQDLCSPAAGTGYPVVNTTDAFHVTVDNPTPAERDVNIVSIGGNNIPTDEGPYLPTNLERINGLPFGNEVPIKSLRAIDINHYSIAGNLLLRTDTELPVHVSNTVLTETNLQYYAGTRLTPETPLSVTGGNLTDPEPLRAFTHEVESDFSNPTGYRQPVATKADDGLSGTTYDCNVGVFNSSGLFQPFETSTTGGILLRTQLQA